MTANKTYIKVDGDNTDWTFVEKLEDKFCTVKNKNTSELFEGVIDSITSRGVYTVELIRKTQ